MSITVWVLLENQWSFLSLWRKRNMRAQWCWLILSTRRQIAPATCAITLNVSATWKSWGVSTSATSTSWRIRPALSSLVTSLPSPMVKGAQILRPNSQREKKGWHSCNPTYWLIGSKTGTFWQQHCWYGNVPSNSEQVDLVYRPHMRLTFLTKLYTDDGKTFTEHSFWY